MKKKRLLLLLIMLFSLSVVSLCSIAQAETIYVTEADFPDEGFRNYLLSACYPTGSNTLNPINVSSLYLKDHSEIKSLKGIHLLNALTLLETPSTLTDTSLDLSANPHLVSVTINSPIKVLNVSGCTNLQSIDRTENCTQLEEIYAAGCSTLGTDDGYFLNAIVQPCKTLKILDLRDCTKLKNIYLPSSALTTLKIDNCTSLKTLNCTNNKLTSVSMSNCSSLEEVDLSGNHLTALDLRNSFFTLKKLNLAFNELTEPCAGYSTSLTELYYDGNKLTSLDLSKFPNLTTCSIGGYWNFEGYDNKGNKITELDLSTNTKLEDLSCDYNQLKALNLNANKMLRRITCSNNQLTSLNLSGLSALEELDCRSNQIDLLDLTPCPALRLLYAMDNNLTSVTVSSKNTSLETLFLYNNKLTKLDVHGATALDCLECIEQKNGFLKELDISGTAFHETSYGDIPFNLYGLEKLIAKSCKGITQLTIPASMQYLDVSDCTALVTVEPSYENTATYNLSTAILQGCSSLNSFTWITEGDHIRKKLTILDVNKSGLEMLNVHGNQLTSLELGSLPHLKQLLCYSNANLSSLDISGCDKLKKIVKGPGKSFTFDGTNYFGWCNSSKANFPTSCLFVDKSLKIIGGDSVSGTSVTLNKAKATLTRTAKKKKPTLTLKATVENSGSADPSFEWTSSNPKVAKVSQNGKVIALKAGKTVITCTVKDGSGASAECKITVKEKAVKKITLNKNKLTLKKGKTFTLKVKAITPKDAFNQKVKWSSSNKKVATVSKNGKIKALKKGSCYIICTAADGSGVKVKCKITVK